MFLIALAIGLYSYMIFLLGIFGVLYKEIIVFSSFIYLFIVIFVFYKLKALKSGFLKTKLSKFSKLLLLLFCLQALINLIGVLGPEIAFDALWYHLTIPKLFLENHKIFHIPGNLLYYSDLPKNIDLIYLSALSISNEILAKIIHFGFGLLSALTLYKLSRKFLNHQFSLLSVLIFYSNLVVSWQSITAYVDLGRTFFEVLSLLAFFNWLEYKKTKWLTMSGIMLGFALASKISAVSSIPIFLLLIIISGIYLKFTHKDIIKNLLNFLFFSLLIPLPYFLFSYFNTNNPFYPLFEKIFQVSHERNPLVLLWLFLFSSDPISPLYLIFIPLIIYSYKQYGLKVKLLLLYSLLALVFWYLISSFGGSRFILPYLPAFSILVAYSLSLIRKKAIKKYLILLIIFVFISSIGYRFLANYKYLPFILGIQSKNEFLTNYLNFKFADFYDTDGYFKSNIKASDKVLLYGFHNLYYINFPFIDSSWVKRGDKFNYIAVQNSLIPERFLDWKEIYYNSKTNVRLYSKEGKQWVY